MNNLIIGRLIKELRIEKNITLRAFAKRIDISQASMSRIENGTQELSYSMLTTVCKELNIGLSEFFGRLEGRQNQVLQFSSKTNEIVDSTEELESKLFSWITSLNDDQKRALYTLLMPYIKD